MRILLSTFHQLGLVHPLGHGKGTWPLPCMHLMEPAVSLSQFRFLSLEASI